MTTRQQNPEPYKGWVQRETYTEHGNTHNCAYSGEMTKSGLLASDEYKLPELLRMRDGRPATRELWGARRLELLDTIRKYGFGYTPPPPPEVRAKLLWTSEKARYAGIVKSYAGKAISERIMLSFDTPKGEFSFPFQLVRPIYVEKPPVLLHIAFRPSLRDTPVSADIESGYSPVEEIIDRGFAYAQFCYNDVIGDDPKGVFAGNGLGDKYFDSDKRPPEAWGKIGMWAFAASRVIDYLLTREELDGSCINVGGHSRLGKTALWCAAQDERVFAGLVNCAGWGGAGLMRGAFESRLLVCQKNGNIDWWNERVKDYLGREDELPYDGHSMIACAAPRYINLVCADGDYPLYQVSDYLSAAAASPAFELLGLPGFVSPEALPRPFAVFSEGHIGYALRPGSHFFSRWDWNAHMDFILLHRNDGK